MGLFARFVCLQRKDSAHGLAGAVRDMLRARNVVETTNPAETERLLMVAPAGPGWLMVFDHVERPSLTMDDADGLLAELSGAGTALDITIADSDEMVLSLMHGGVPQSYLLIGDGGVKGGTVEACGRLLQPGRSLDNIRKAFAPPTTFVEEHLPALKPLFGIDLAAFKEVARGGQPAGADVVLLRLKAVAAPGQSAGPPRLEVDESQRKNFDLNNSYPQIPCGLITNFPAITFQSRGGGARGLEVLLTGSALERGLIEVVSGLLMQEHPVDRKRGRKIEVVPEATSAGPKLHFPDLEVPDWVQPDLGRRTRVPSALQDLRVGVYCRGLRPGKGELEAEANLVAPRSGPARTSYPVTVLPAMWHPLKGSDRPHMIHYVLALNRPTRINALAVLRGGVDEAVSALRRTLETWRSLIDPGGTFTVAAATEPVQDYAFHRPADSANMFTLDLSNRRQTKWNRLLADLPALQGLRVQSEVAFGPGGARADYQERYAARVCLHYVAPALHPHMPEYAARLGHVALSLSASAAAESALAGLMQALAAAGLIGQGYVAAWDHDDDPSNTIYESAADIFVHQRAAQGWGTRYLRAVADRLWLGPGFAAMLPDRAALERVAMFSAVGDTLAIERRPEAMLRDLELCLEPMLATQADSQAFWDRFRPPAKS